MCVGPLRILCHWGPFTALGIIKVVSFTTIHCNLQYWPPGESLSGVVNSTLFLILSASTIYNFLSSVYTGPGHLPLGWRPANETDCDQLQRCNVCRGYKAPRSHHCKKCGRCVMKMDHHCPWINSCVGHHNHTSFTLFLFFAVCGCFQATIILSCSIYYALYRNWYLYHGTGREPVVILSFNLFVLSVFALGLAIGVVLAVGMLLFFQLRAIIRNRTAIEDWIVSKANYRRQMAELQGEAMDPFIFPYNLGRWKNTLQVLNTAMTPAGDGITWVTVPGCDQFSLTREQKEQKLEKRHRSRPFVATKVYSGHWLPVVYGFRVFCSPPCTDEARLPLHVGDFIVVTRTNKHWLFGEKRVMGKSMNSVEAGKGWFPRCCAIPVEGGGDTRVGQEEAKEDKEDIPREGVEAETDKKIN